MLRKIRPGNRSILATFIVSSLAIAAVVIWLRLSGRMNDSESLSVLFAFFAAFMATWASTSAAQQVNESKEQRLAAFQPLILVRAKHVFTRVAGDMVSPTQFRHFTVWNAGSGPAIELEVSLLDKEKKQLQAQRETFVRAGDEITFGPEFQGRLAEKYYLVCEYKHVLFPTRVQEWDQTWLPFELVEASTAGNHYVKAGEIEFKFRIANKERLDAFTRSSKPQ